MRHNVLKVLAAIKHRPNNIYVWVKMSAVRRRSIHITYATARDWCNTAAKDPPFYKEIPAFFSGNDIFLGEV